MFTSTISKSLVVFLVLAVLLVTASFVTRSANVPAADRSYDSIEQIRSQRSSTVVAGKYDDRYDRMSALPSADSSYDGVEQMRAQRSSAVVETGKYYDRYDRMNALPSADHSYDKIEALRLGR